MAVANTRLLLEGRTDELIETLRDRMVGRGRRASGSRRRRSCATRCAPCRRCATGSRRWRLPSSATATCSGSRSGRAAARSRSSRCAAAASSNGSSWRPIPARSPAVTPTSCRPRWRSSTSSRVPPPEINLPVEIEDVEAMEEWLSSARRPPGQDSGAAARRQARARGTGDAQRRARRIARGSTRSRRRISMRWRRCEPAGAAGDSAPDRLLRHLDDPGQRDRGVDGRLRRRPDEEERVPEVPDARVASSAEPKPEARSPISAPTTSPRCARSCSGGIEACSRAAGRFRI